jgi:endonuclease/exonuclease/phosphatase family metal-dependent hydrolase
VLRFRVGTGAGPVDIHATHLEHSDQEKQATQVAEITSAIPRRAVSEGGVPGKETGFLSAFHLRIILPRQARDKHRGSFSKGDRVFAAERTLVLGDMNICEGRYRGKMYELLSAAMGNVGLSANLSAGCDWTPCAIPFLSLSLCVSLCLCGSVSLSLCLFIALFISVCLRLYA